VHVPKTIYNNLPLPPDAVTFGFSTARQVGMGLVQNFLQDSRTMLRWYVLVVSGRVGQLALGIGKAAAATVTIIPEDFGGIGDNTLTFEKLVDVMQACIIKRRAMSKEYGTICVCEGVVDLMDQKEIKDRWGNLEEGHYELGRHCKLELESRFDKTKKGIIIRTRNIGNELRSAPPNTEDVMLTRDLGFGSIRFLLEGGTGCMITLKGGSIHAIPLSDIIDPKTGQTLIRQVDVNETHYQVAQNYMIKLKRSDFGNKAFLNKLAMAANLSVDDFVKKFYPVASGPDSHVHISHSQAFSRAN
jgi:6-phosphofructokinase 1